MSTVVEPPPVVARLQAVVDDVCTTDAALLSDEAICAELEALHRERARLDAREVRLLTEAFDRDSTVTARGRAVRSFLVEAIRVNPGEASMWMALMRLLPSRPLLYAALLAGDISREHVRVVLRALREVPSELEDTVEDALVQACREYPPIVVSRLVDDILVALGVESSAEAAAERRRAQQGVTVAETFGGLGSLGGTTSALLRHKLEKAFAVWASRGATPGDNRTRAQRNHDALEDIVDSYLDRHAAGADDDADVGGDETEPDEDGFDDEAEEQDGAEVHPARWRGDAAERDAAADAGEMPGERPVVRATVTIPLDVLMGWRDRFATLGTETPIGPEEARRLACDAEIIPVVLGGAGEVLDIGQARRSFPTPVRRAAWIEQRGRCAFPRCRRPPAHAHHVVWFSRGGKSTLDNCAWLCAFHHMLVHEGGWAAVKHGPGRFTFTSPDGYRAHSPPRGRAA